MEPGALVVAEVPEGLDLARAGVRIARVPQVLLVAPRRLLLSGGRPSPAPAAALQVATYDDRLASAARVVGFKGVAP